MIAYHRWTCQRTNLTLSQFVSSLAKQFSLKDLGNLSYFLGVEVISHKYGLLLSQCRYITNLLTRLHMHEAKPVLTPLPSTASAVSLKSGSPIPDPTIYREVVAVFNTYLLHDRMCRSQSTNCLSSYTFQLIHTGFLSIVFYVISLVHLTRVFFCAVTPPVLFMLLLTSFMLFWMLIGKVTRMIIPQPVPI